MTLTPHTIALIGIVGSSLDVLGTLYLAYDLLGGPHGPLRTLTRAVTYSALFGVGFGLAIDPVFGIVCGIAHGSTLAWELSRASRNASIPGLLHDSIASSIRGASFVVGAIHSFTLVFGLVFGGLSTIGQIIAYRFGIRPTLDHRPTMKPRITKLQLLAALNRMVGYAATGWLATALSHAHVNPLSFGIRMGLTIGAITVIFSACAPFIEWISDHAPERAMGAFGIVLILIGFCLQSVPNWATLLEPATGQ